MAGNAGAGKSYVITKIKSGQIEPRIVNVDVWIEYYTKQLKSAGITGSIYDTPHHDKSKKLTVNQLYLYINSMLPLWIDSTSTDPLGVVKRYSILESLGYDIAMVFVQTSLETSLERAANRNERVVPPDKVKEYYEKAMEVKDFLKGRFPLFMVVNNDTGELTDEVVTKAFKKMLFFFDSPLQNPVGKRTIDLMKDNKWKYLTPDVYSDSELKGIVNSWYRSTS